MPASPRASREASAIGSSRTMACSATHAVPLSKAFDSTTMSAASAMSGTLRWMYTGTLPAPTAIVGFPDE